VRFKYLIYVYTNTPPQSKKQYRQILLKPEAEKWCLKKKNRQKSRKPEAEKWRLNCNIAKKLLKPEAEKWHLDRGVKEFLCARAIFTYCKYVLFCIYDTESTDQVFLRYRYGNYRQIPTDTDQKYRVGITLLFLLLGALFCSRERSCARAFFLLR
jgi:hypothetical protein